MFSRRKFILCALAAPLTFAWSGAGFASTGDALKFSELYVAGMEFSAKVRELAGKPVAIRGFMAPPLKAESDFFVLTKMPMAVCPFCENEAEWPDDIIFVKMNGVVPPIPFNRAIEVRGILDTGTEVDAQTGFVSRVRIVDAVVERV